MFRETNKAIGLVVNSFDKGGLEQVVLNLYKEYKKNGRKVYILVQDNNVGEFADYIDDVREIYIFNNDWHLFLDACYKFNIYILHYHYNVFFLKYAKLFGFKTIYTIHNVYTWLNDFEMKQRTALLENVDILVAVSSYVKKYFCKRTRIKEDRVKVIINGIDFKELDGIPAKLAKNNIVANNGDVVFVNVASFHRVKHQAILIGAVKKVIPYRQNFKVCLVGNIGDQSYYNEIINLIKDSHLTKFIEHIPYIPRNQIGDFLKNVADVFIFPSLQEGCSNAVLEAIYCNLPMILTDVGNAKDIESLKSVRIIHPAYNDILELNYSLIDNLSKDINTPNVDELASTMIEFIDNIGNYRKLAFEEHDKSAQFTSTFMASNYLTLINKF